MLGRDVVAVLEADGGMSRDSRQELDITGRCRGGHGAARGRPDVVVNCAGGPRSTSETHEEPGAAVNVRAAQPCRGRAAGYLAGEVRLVQLSPTTCFGRDARRPLSEHARVARVLRSGRSGKLAGSRPRFGCCPAPPTWCGPHGGTGARANFARTLIRSARAADSLDRRNDQRGQPYLDG